MKNLSDPSLIPYRRVDLEMMIFKEALGTHGGVWQVRSVTDGRALNIIASNGFGWDHVSVSRNDKRCPNWLEMEQVKRMFFLPHETCWQYHPALDQYVDGTNPGGRALYTLHIWRSQALAMPLPPRFLIGGMTPAEADTQAAAYLKEHPEYERD